MSDRPHDPEYGAQVLDWAQRLIITKGYGWSKAVDTARDLLAGPPTAPKPAPAKPPKAKQS